jgi:hypothetical protein
MTVARVLLRRIIGPLTMWDPTDPGDAWREWEAALTPALLDGLAAAIQVGSSPTSTANSCTCKFSTIAA